MRGDIEITSLDDMEGSMQLFMQQYPLPKAGAREYVCN
jgi:hypothetical protein